MSVLQFFLVLIRNTVVNHAELAAENIALRQQLAAPEREEEKAKVEETRSHLLGLAVQFLAELALRPVSDHLEPATNLDHDSAPFLLLKPPQHKDVGNLDQEMSLFRTGRFISINGGRF